MAASRLTQQLNFILEIDKLKQVLRQTRLTDGSRRENSAEHSWHLAMMAIALQEYAPTPVDLLRVLKMLLVHDVVEIDAGDTFAFDLQANQNKAAREQQAADRLFGLLPDDLAIQLHAIWNEFEAVETADAQFAKALDCLQPFLHNCQNQGGTWKEHKITRDRVLWRMQAVQHGTPALWATVQNLIDESIELGYLQS